MSKQIASPKPLIVALGAVVASVWTFSQIYMAETTGSYVTGEGAFVSTSLLVFLCLPFALRLAPIDFAALFAIVEGASASSVLLPALVGLPILLGLPSNTNWGDMFASVPFLLRPNRDVAILATFGGAPIPFATIMPSLLFAIVLNSLIWASLSLQMFLLRDNVYSLRTVSYPVPSATCSLVKESVSGERRLTTGINLLTDFSLGFVLVSFTEGYLSSNLLSGLYFIPAGYTASLYSPLRQFLPGSLLGLDIASNIPYIWFLLFVPSSVSASVSIAGAAFYLLLLPLEVQMGIIPEQYTQSYTSLLSAGGSIGITSVWLGTGLFISSAVGVFLERERLPRPKRKEIPKLLLALAFLLPPVLLAWALGSNAMVLGAVMLTSLFTASVWSARGLAEVNMAFSPSDVIVNGSWPLVSKTLGVRSVCYGDSVSFFTGGYLAVAASLGGATSLESVKLGDMLNQDHRTIFTYFALGSAIGLILGPIMYLWLLFRLGTQSRVLGGRALDMVDQVTGIYSARSQLVDHSSPLSIDPTSLAIGCAIGLGLPFLASYFLKIALSPYAFAMGVFMDPASTVLPYAIVSVARYFLFEREKDEGTIRSRSTLAAGLASGAVSAALLSTVISSLS